MVGTFVTPAIDAGQIVQVNPSALPAGGSAIDLLGLILTDNPRVPVGQLYSFPNDGSSIASFFGPTSRETALGSVYMLGFNGSSKKPDSLYYYRYAWKQGANAYLRGGSVAALTVAQIQALSGTLSITIDGVAKNASINLASSTSLSNAAYNIGAALGITGPTQGNYTGSISGTTLSITAVTNGPQTASYSGSISGNTLSVTAVNSGYIAVGDLVTGSGVTAGTTITALGSGEGQTGTYTVSAAQSAPLQTLTDFNPAGVLAIGDILTAPGITAGTYIVALGTGAGGSGTYIVNNTQTFAGGTMTASLPGAYYDSVSGGIVIQSASRGAGSSITYASGTLAPSLNLTQQTGAVLSQGAAQSTPAGAMTAVTAISKNFASFMTSFEPSDNDKVGFAAWNNTQNNRYHYAMWDTNILNTEVGGPSPAVAAITAANYSGVSLIYDNPAVDTIGGEIAAFVMGFGASIDFDETQGRATAAFKSQTGLTAQVYGSTSAANLLGYGMNFYGDYTTADQSFTFYNNGSVSGDFDWLDTYLDEIWLTNQLQLAGMDLLTTVRSLPYNQAGYTMVYEAFKGAIIAAVQAGVIQPGIPLSASQIDDVNASAGQKIDNIISTIGWYLKIGSATPAVRQARGTPPCTLWYQDGGSIQKLTLASITLL